MLTLRKVQKTLSVGLLGLVLFVTNETPKDQKLTRPFESSKLAPGRGLPVNEKDDVNLGAVPTTKEQGSVVRSLLKNLSHFAATMTYDNFRRKSFELVQERGLEITSDSTLAELATIIRNPNENPSERQSAMWLIEVIGRAATTEDMIEAIAAALGDRNITISGGAIGVIEAFREVAVTPHLLTTLGEYLQDSSGQIRQSALVALRSLHYFVGDEVLTPSIRSALERIFYSHSEEEGMQEDAGILLGWRTRSDVEDWILEDFGEEEPRAINNVAKVPREKPRQSPAMSKTIRVSITDPSSNRSDNPRPITGQTVKAILEALQEAVGRPILAPSGEALVHGVTVKLLGMLDMNLYGRRLQSALEDDTLLADGDSITVEFTVDSTVSQTTDQAINAIEQSI